jgi:tRNA(His) 5'-end guanylyltransferase
MFDARCFNIPKEEVTNLVYWRQLDAIRNSIQMVGQAYFSSKELHGKSCKEIKEMLINEREIAWDTYCTFKKWGSACYKNKDLGWSIDFDMPILKGENRNYVERLINFE